MSERAENESVTSPYAIMRILAMHRHHIGWLHLVPVSDGRATPETPALCGLRAGPEFRWRPEPKESVTCPTCLNRYAEILAGPPAYLRTLMDGEPDESTAQEESAAAFEKWQSTSFCGGLQGSYGIAKKAWHARDAEVAALKAALEKVEAELQAFRQSISEALNSGDGTYRP